MADQYDVFQNPIAAQRKTYPVVVVLQSPFAGLANSRIVAPATLAPNLLRIAGVLTPVFKLEDRQYVLHVPALTTTRLENLKTKLGNVAACRDAITAALDHLLHDNS